jgi:hypothetical protein
MRILEQRFDSALLRLAALRDQKLALKAADAAASSFTDDVREYVGSGHAHFTRVGGKFAKSIKIKYPRDGALVQCKAKHAAALEYGTRPHEIEPRARRGKRALRFTEGQGVLARRRVQHPGTKPYPFFYADLPARKARMQQAIADVVRPVLKGE